MLASVTGPSLRGKITVRAKAEMHLRIFSASGKIPDESCDPYLYVTSSSGSLRAHPGRALPKNLFDRN
jgi:hypothetical protein